jgi:hypothetical protein
MYQPRSRRLRNPDQLRRHERYHRAMGEFRNVKLDNKPQLKGRMTFYTDDTHLTAAVCGAIKSR